MKAFGVEIGTREREGKITFLGNTAWTELLVETQPKTIRLDVRANGADIAPMIIFGGKPYESSSNAIGFSLDVPVRWVGGIPQTRQRGKDNLDVIFVDGDLHFRDVQVGLITRGGRFFLTAQVIFEGWIREVEGQVVFIPGQPEFTYPGMDYRAVWKDMGEVLAVMARMAADVAKALGGKPLEDKQPAEWNPAVIPQREGWLQGTVLFFNAVTGTGEIFGEDGQRYFVHFSRIITDSPVPMLRAGAGAHFRPDPTLNPQNPEKRQVLSCAPA